MKHLIIKITMIEQYKDQMRGYLTELLDEKDLPLVDELFDFLIKKTDEESKISTRDSQVRINELLSNADIKTAFQTAHQRLCQDSNIKNVFAEKLGGSKNQEKTSIITKSSMFQPAPATPDLASQSPTHDAATQSSKAGKSSEASGSLKKG